MSTQVDEQAVGKKIEAALAAVQMGQYEAFDAWMLLVPDLTALFAELRNLRSAVGVDPQKDSKR